MPVKRSFSLSALTVTTLLVSSALTGVSGAAPGGRRDTDGDGIPDRWERTHGMNPNRAADARQDFDADRLTNLREFRLGARIRDEDSDDDGHDDGDEVTDGTGSTDVTDPDTDDDGTRDGDEDSDRDQVDNEDEDDAGESCRLDDDDRDADAIDDEDENDFGLRVGDADSDDDGTPDGDEDDDADGTSNEDDDDSLEDSCVDDGDGDGRSDEDEGDLLGAISSFDATSGLLVVLTGSGAEISGLVTEDTEIEIEDAESEGGDDGGGDDGGGDEGGDDPEDRASRSDEGTVDDLVPGVQVAELDRERGSEEIEEITIYRVPTT